jgi:hypothetical protein
MSLNNALIFISRVDTDVDFRKSCYLHKSQTELLSMLSDKGMGCTYDEILDAFNVLLLQCTTYEQAGRVNEIKAWFNVFTKIQGRF